MTIDLNKNEIELLDKALETWESEAKSSTLMGSMMTAILCPKEEREENKNRMNKEMLAAEVESQSRRVKSLLLRAKLYQSLARESEHTADSQPITP